MKWVKEATESRAIWPYRVKEKVIRVEASGQLMAGTETLEVLSFRNWKVGSSLGIILDGNAQWNLYQCGIDWTHVKVDLILSIEKVDEFKNAVLQSKDGAELMFVIQILCPATRYRNALTTAFGDGCAEASLTFERGMVAGEIEIIPFVVLANDIVGAPTGWAIKKASKVGTGFPVYINADEPANRPGGGIDVMWGELNGEALYKLDIPEYADADEKPVLYLNNRYTVLKAVVDDISRANNDRTRIRDALFAFIALDVWMQLAKSAAMSATSDEADTEMPLYSSILNTLSRRIGYSKDDLKEAFLRNDIGLIGEIHLALQNFLSLAKRHAELVSGIEDKNHGGD